MKYALALIGLAIASIGCGGTASVTEPDASVDAEFDAGLDAMPDGPRVYCSSRCGPVGPADAPDGSGQLQECPPGNICGQYSTLAGLECCDPSNPLCAVGSPEVIGGCK